MKSSIYKYFLYIIGGYVILSLCNLILRNSLQFQNLLILLLILSFLYFGKSYLIKLFKKIERLPPFLVLSLLTIPAVISLFLFYPAYWDDLLTLHNQALADLSEGRIKLGYPYSIRNLFYLLPIYSFLGTSLWIVKSVNLVFYILSVFIFYKILKNLFSNKIIYTYIGMFLFFSIPYFALSVSIPHYDLPSTLYLLLSIAIIQHLLKIIFLKNVNTYKLIFFSFLLGISFIPLFYTRGAFMVFILVIIFFVIISFFKNSVSLRFSGKIFIFVFIIPFTLFFVFNSFLKNLSSTDNTKELWTVEQKIFSYNDTRFDGASEHQDKKWVYFPQITKDLRKQYAILKLNSEIFYNWPWYLYRLSTKNQVVYKIGGLNMFVTHDFLYKDNLDLFFEYWEIILQYLISIFAIIGLILFLSSSSQMDLFRSFSLIFIFVATFFVLFAETRSRYSLLFVFALIIFALDGIRYFIENDFSAKRFLKRGVYYSAISLIFLGSLLFIYRQTAAKNYSFLQIAPVKLRKDIGKINLTAFQKKITTENAKVYFGKPKINNGSVSFFVRCSKKNVENLKMSIFQDKKERIISILPNEFETLFHNHDLVVNFFRIDLNKVKEKDVYIDFKGSSLDENVVVEFVSFNK